VLERSEKERESNRIAPEGEEFHFMKSVGFILPTHFIAFDLFEFGECIKKISSHSLYHHIFEARIRLERESDDFSNWLINQLHENDLARLISQLDPYTQTLEGLRKTILQHVDRRLEEILPQEDPHATR
jgi:hypothetical protein